MSEFAAAMEKVKEEDRGLFKDIFTMLDALQMFSTWDVKLLEDGYFLECAFRESRDNLMLSVDQMTDIQQVSVSRIHQVGTKVYAQTKRPYLYVKVFFEGRSMVEECTVLRVKKRRSFIPKQSIHI
jgi:hypothetical protein